MNDMKYTLLTIIIVNKKTITRINEMQSDHWMEGKKNPNEKEMQQKNHHHFGGKDFTDCRCILYVEFGYYIHIDVGVIF